MPAPSPAAKADHQPLLLLDAWVLLTATGFIALIPVGATGEGVVTIAMLVLPALQPWLPK